MRNWIAGLLLAAVIPASAEIYRCEIDGVIVFSDRPCQAESTPYEPGPGLSVVSVADDMAATIERNRAWLEAEAARLQARRQALLEHRARPGERDLPVAPAASASPFIALPYLAPPQPAIDRRLERGQREARPPQQGSEEAEESFSALRGRQPGSRRDP